VALDRAAPTPKINAEIDRRFAGSWSGYERDRLFLNPDGPEPRFYNAEYVYGLDFDHDGRAIAPVDIDGDGDLDLVFLTLAGLRIVENRAAPAHFSRIALKPASPPFPALGAIVRLTAGGVTRQDSVRVVDGYLTHVPTDLHFGLGTCASIESVEVRWPSGANETWKNLPVDQRVVLTEGSAAFEAAPLPRWTGRPATAEWLNRDAIAGLSPSGRPLVLVVDPASAIAVTELEALAKFHAGVDVACLAPTPPRSAQVAGVPATPAQIARIFDNGKAPASPSTLVFARDGRLARAFGRIPSRAHLAPLLASLGDEPPFPIDSMLLGRAAIDRLDFQKAHALFEEAVRLRPQSTVARMMDGLALVGLKRHAEALVRFQEAVDADPEFTWAQINLGTALVELGRHAEAVQTFRRAEAQWPAHFGIQIALGNALAGTGRLDEGLGAFDRAISLKPKDPAGWLGRGKVRVLKKQVDPARADLAEVLRLDPGNREAAELKAALDRR